MNLCYLVFIGMCLAQFSRGELARPVNTGCHEKLRPRKLRPTLKVLWSRNVHRYQPERSETFIFSGLSLSRLVDTKLTTI